MNYSKVIVAVLIYSLTACGSESTPAEGGNSNETSTVAIESSPISKLQTSPCDLISIDKIATVTGVDAGKIEEESKIYDGSKSKHITAEMSHCHYEWQGGRMMTISGMTMAVESTISVGFIETPNEKDVAKWFDQKYHGLTAEESASLNASIQEELENETDDVKNVGNGITNMMNGIRFNKVDDLGDLAVYEENGTVTDITLYILHKDTKFAVQVGAATDKETNVKIAIEVGKLILASL